MRVSSVTIYEIESAFIFFLIISLFALQPWLIFDIFDFDFFIEYSDLVFFYKSIV